MNDISSVPSDVNFEVQNSMQRRGLNPLDSFFPFDPCLLSQVHEYVQSGYVTWEGIRGLDYMPPTSSTNNFVGEGEVGEEDDNDIAQSMVSSVSSSITSLSLAQSHRMGESYGAAMSVGMSFNAANSLSSTYSSCHNQVSFEPPGEVSCSPYNIRVLEKRTRQYSVGSTGSW